MKWSACAESPSYEAVKFPKDWLSSDHHWIFEERAYKEICDAEVGIYNQIGTLCAQLSGQRELSKAKGLIEKAEEYDKILAFDSTIITLDYLSHILIDNKTTAEIIVATGQNEKNKKLVRDSFSIANSETNKKLIALCSDAMAEGINLPSAKALMLLDMPSVLRIIEQRIGRLERMDSEHKEIHIFWPDDSEEFSLNGDKRIVETLLLTESLIGSNVGIPKQIFEKHYKSGMTTANIMEAYREYSSEEFEWRGVKDSTQNLYSLIEGKDALIDQKIYNDFKDVDATVKSAISFVESTKAWSFFAFRGDSVKSPKWLFIDEHNKAFTDFSEITEKLKTHLDREKIVQRKWSEVNTSEEIRKIMSKLRSKERELLSWKKKRALETAEKILGTLLKKGIKNESRKELVRSLKRLFSSDPNDDAVIDYDKFAEMWLTVLQPALDEKRNSQKRKRRIVSLRNLSAYDVKLENKTLTAIYEGCQAATTLDAMIASCIISVQRKAQS